MKRALIGLGLLGAMAAAIGAGTVALADHTPTVMLSAGVVVDRIEFTFTGTGASTIVRAESCGHTTLSGGGNSDHSCRTGILPLGALRTSVLALRTGDALTFWRGLFPGL
jgi:hypothetical protein